MWTEKVSEIVFAKTTFLHHILGLRHHKKPLIGPDTIFVEDNEEDLGTPLTTATTDDMNVIDVDLPISPKATTMRHVQRSKCYPSTGRKAIPSLALNGQRSSGPHARGGPSTQTLERTPSDHHEDAESDPIAYFPEDPEPFPMTLNSRGKRGGNVNAMVSQIEGTVGPRVDLRMTSRMRAKVTLVSLPYSKDRLTTHASRTVRLLSAILSVLHRPSSPVYQGQQHSYASRNGILAQNISVPMLATTYVGRKKQ